MIIGGVPMMFSESEASQPPLVGDIHINSVSLLLYGEETNGATSIVDSSQTPETMSSFLGASVTTVRSKFGSSSLNFTGAGQYFQNTSASSSFNFVSDFTLEWWEYSTDGGNRGRIHIQNNTLPANGPGIGTGVAVAYNGTGWCVYLGSNNVYGSWNNSGLGVPALLNQWVHVALVRSSGLVRLFVNGMKLGNDMSQASALPGGSTQYVTIGAYYDLNYAFSGQMDDVRVTNGIARYNTNFTPPSESFHNFYNPPAVTPGGDPNYNNVSLLLHFDGTDGSTVYIDNSISPKVFSNGGAAILSTAQTKFGSASLYLDGSDTSYIYGSPATSVLATPSLTIEAWVKVAVPGAGISHTFLCSRRVGTAGFYFVLEITDTLIRPFFYAWSQPQTSFAPIYGPYVSHGDWVHIALTRDSGTWRIFTNGVLGGVAVPGQINSPAETGTALYIGKDSGSIYSTRAIYIDDMRITDGVARYVDSFTPNTETFKDY